MGILHFAAIALLAGSPMTALAEPPPVFHRCTVENYSGPARCGTVDVPENPDQPHGRILSLNVLVLAAVGPESERLPDPVFVLDGGPGLAATKAVDWVAADLSAVLQKRDVVLVDRRGTGKSNPLDCPAPDPSLPMAERLARDPAEIAATCRTAVEKHADLTKYTSPFAADDLDAVRQALGYDRINLYGGSYGSREAFEYMRRHSRHLRSGAVFAVTPQNEQAGILSPRTAETAMARLIDACMADAPCRGAYPALRSELDAVVTRLEKHPEEFRLTSEDGAGERLELTRERFGSLLRSLMVSDNGAALIPYLIHRTYLGHPEDAGNLFVRLVGSSSAISRGLFLSVTCAEEMASVQPNEIERLAKDTFWGPGWPQSILNQCRQWPRGDLPPDWFEPPRGDTPFLLMSGWVDPIAAPAWAQTLNRSMPNARRVVVREGQHGFSLDDCAKRTLAHFYDTADPFDLDVHCIAALKRAPFKLP